MEKWSEDLGCFVDEHTGQLTAFEGIVRYDDKPAPWKHAESLAQKETFTKIAAAVSHARDKYSWTELEYLDKYAIFEREAHEMALAMFKGDARGVEAEALDVIAVLIRIIEKD